jgi:hypothetical protein
MKVESLSDDVKDYLKSARVDPPLRMTGVGKDDVVVYNVYQYNQALDMGYAVSPANAHLGA